MVPALVNNLKAPSRAAGEVVDEHGIIIQPAEGELKTYERTGQGMLGEDYGDGMFLYYEAQDGTIEVVECSDGMRPKTARLRLWSAVTVQCTSKTSFTAISEAIG